MDAPQRLYHRPANTFVASFIGSPPMNFLEGALRDDAIESGRRFELPGVRERLRRGEGPVLVGLRPESFKDVHLAGSDADVMLPAEIEVAEQLGHETYAYFRVPGSGGRRDRRAPGRARGRDGRPARSRSSAARVSGWR